MAALPQMQHFAAPSSAYDGWMRTLSLVLVLVLAACAADDPDTTIPYVPPASGRVHCEQTQWGDMTIAYCDPECLVEPAYDATPCSYIDDDGAAVTQPGSFFSSSGVRGYCGFVHAEPGRYRPIEVGFYACD